MQMPAAPLAVFLNRRQGLLRKKPLMKKLFRSLGILLLHGIIQKDPIKPGSQIWMGDKAETSSESTLPEILEEIRNNQIKNKHVYRVSVK
jgi:hypothetical protein